MCINFGFSRKSIRVFFNQVVFIFAGQFKIYPNQFYTFPFFTLFPCANHIGIILFGKNNLISCF